MKKSLILFICAAILLPLAAAKPAQKKQNVKPADTKISVTAEKSELKCGDKVVFNIKLTGKDIAKQAIIVTLDGNAKIRDSKTVVTDSSGNAKIEVPAHQPGTVFCDVRLKKQRSCRGYAGVAVDKEKVIPALPCPADFNAYWSKIKAALDARPMDAIITPEPVKIKNVKGFKVILPMGGDGKDGYGKLSYPANAKPKSLPAFLLVHGAGTAYVGVQEHRAIRNGGVLVFSISPMPADSKGGVYPAKTGKFRGYRFWNADNRDKNFFNMMYQRVYRSLQFLKSRPEWDGKTLIVLGTSQGGGQALVAGGLDPQVTMVAAHVPALCHQGGRAAGGDAGWPHYFLTSAYKKNREAVLKATAYIDAVNFARNIKNARVFISTGYVDRTCPAESVFAAYNVIPSANKKLFCTPGASHRVAPAARAAAEQAISDHIKTGR